MECSDDDKLPAVEWRYVPFTNCEIMVSNMGCVKQFHVHGKRWWPPKWPTVTRHGYPSLTHRQKILRVHVLVCRAFHGPPPTPEHTVDHIAKYDGDWRRERSDNRAENLRWATKQQQAENRRMGSERCNDGTEQGPALWDADEDFRPRLSGWSVSQYGRVRNPQGVVYTPKAPRGMDYAMFAARPFHVVVAEAFADVIGPKPSASHTVDHIDRNKDNNHLSNLRWATNREQQLNTSRPARNTALLNLKRAVACRSPGETEWRCYDSFLHAAQKTGVHPNTIRQAIQRNPYGHQITQRKNAGWWFKLQRDSMSLPV
jgi:hypothetical protein